VTTESKLAVRTTAAWVADQTAMEALYGVGGYYTTPQLWEAGEQDDITSATGTDEIAIVEIYDDQDWSGQLLIDGWTTAAGQYIIVRAAPGEECTADWADGGAHLTYNDKATISPREGYIRVEGLRVTATYNGIRAYQSGTAVHYIVNCHIRTTAGAGNIKPYEDDATVYAYGCIGEQTGGTLNEIFEADRGLLYTKNCIAIGGNFGFRDCSDPTNCISYGSSDRSFYGVDGTISYCASDDSYATGTGSITGIGSDEFADYASGDFHLDSASQLIGAGTNLYSSPYDSSGFQYDIDGDEWPSSGDWDIGADYYVEGAAPGGITGTGALAAQSSIISASGTIGRSGTGALAAAAAEISASGTLGRTGTGALEAATAALAGSGKVGHPGTGSLEAGAAEISGTGTVTSGITGTGGLAAQAAEISGTGTIGRSGTGALEAQASSLSAAGIIGRIGTGVLEAQPSEISGTGTVVSPGVITGSGVLEVQPSEISGTGIVGRIGSGVLEAQAAALSGTGVIGRSGTGVLQAQAAAISGTGTIYAPGAITGTGALVCGACAISGIGTKSGWSPETPKSNSWTPESGATNSWV